MPLLCQDVHFIGHGSHCGDGHATQRGVCPTGLLGLDVDNQVGLGLHRDPFHLVACFTTLMNLAIGADDAEFDAAQIRMRTDDEVDSTGLWNVEKRGGGLTSAERARSNEVQGCPRVQGADDALFGEASALGSRREIDKNE